MCGITAIFAYDRDAPPVRREELEAITARMIPRGPDAGGTWTSSDQRVALGARRLAIIDLTPGGDQPMHSEDGAVSLVFNGEIYNHRELRRLLQRQGAKFRSTSDTEVVLEMYRHYGDGMLELLRGMFAIALWDSRSGELLVARDPYGIKPLYFADDGRTFRVASTVKALLAGGAIERRLDATGLARFLMLGSITEPHTWIEHIRSVEAGTSMIVSSSGRRRPRSYYSIAGVFRHADDQRTIAELTTPSTLLRELVTESISQHLVSDVPAGLFLSGGIDSAAIAALAASHSSRPLQATTIVFDAYRGTHFDEAAAASAFAASIGIRHSTRNVTRDEFIADLPKIFDAMDQPTIDGVNTWFVSKAAAEQGLKVALTGVGGDELFGSYPSFVQVPRIVRVASAASRTRAGRRALAATVSLVARNPKAHAVSRVGGTYPGAYLAKRGLFMPWELPPELTEGAPDPIEILTPMSRVLEPDPGTPFGRVATLEAALYLRNQLLRDTDWASMAHSLEVRTPLVDAHLLRQLAPLLLVKGVRCKQYFGEAPGAVIPVSIRDRPKTGFQSPIGDWLDLPPDGTTTRMRSWARTVMEQFR